MVLFLSIFNYSEMILPLISIFYLNMVFGGGVFWYGAERQNLFDGGTVLAGMVVMAQWTYRPI